MKTIWEKLEYKKPIMILAPMEDVTDTVFRQIIIKCGRPDLFFTEFTNVDGMCSEGKIKVMDRLKFSPVEKPIIAQIWGNNPDHFFKAVKMVKQMGFDGVDINMGCPDKTIVKKGCCGGLINNLTLAREIINATKKAAQIGTRQIPVSVKTRIGYDKINKDWIRFLLEQDLDALTLHLRTVKEQSKVKAHWEEMEYLVNLRDKINKRTLIIGNGDVMSYQEAIDKTKMYVVDGIMIGRGIFHNLWIFSNRDPQTISKEEKCNLLVDHISLFEKIWSNKKPFDLIKKFYKVYVSGFPNANEIRLKMMELKTPKAAIAFIESLMNQTGRA